MKKLLTSVFTLLLALLCGGVLLFAAAVLTGRWPQAETVHVKQMVLIELDGDWADGLAALPDARQMKAEIDQTVADVQALGGNAAALTGLTSDGYALFLDSTEALTTAPNIAAEDRLLSRFDPVQYLVRQAAKAGVEVCLLENGTAAPTGQLMERYDLYRMEAQPEGYVLYFPSEQLTGAMGAVRRADGQPGVLAMAMQSGGYYGVCLGGITALRADASDAALYRAFAQGALPDLTAAKAGKTVAQTLAVTYPVTDGSTVYTSKVFLMGTSDPAADLTVNGETVARGNDRGVWGVLLPLEKGANTFTLQNGSEALTWTVKRGSSSGGSTQLKNDSTQPAAEGQYLQITDAIASALTDPASSDTISQTLYKGAVARVVASKRYSTGSKYTYAYQLATGDWIRSSVCKLLSNGGDAAFTAPQVRYDSAARSTVLTFAGGTPAVYHDWTGNVLALTFLSAGYEGELPALPDWITAAAVENTGSGFTLTLAFSGEDPLYGWAVNYDTEADTTEIWLKRAPKLSGDPSAPLAGVVVMLDAGHGGTDDGAMGAAGMDAPVEKELNLAAATAARHRLQQLGATVLMTRTGDEFPSLGDRVTALNEQHPDFFIAVHHNSIELSVDVNGVWGTEAYWFYDEGEALANTLVDGVCAVTGRQRRGVEYGYYYVTRSNICPAVLLELGFMTNPTEYAECEKDASLWADGTAIAQAVYRMVAANG